MNKEAIISACKMGDRKAQQALYQELSPLLYAICKRYLKQIDELEDVFSESFVIIFSKMDGLKDPEALFGWAKRIVVNQCLQALRKKVNFNLSLDDIKQEPAYSVSTSQDLEHKQLLSLLNFLPDGCRSVFNLFAVEGYTHKEIAGLLQISEGTSKSQLNVARIKLQKLVHIYYQTKAEENGIAK